MDKPSTSTKLIPGKKRKASYRLPTDYSHPDSCCERSEVNEAIHLAQTYRGPVHINVLLREPFLSPKKTEGNGFFDTIRRIMEAGRLLTLSKKTSRARSWEDSRKRILIVANTRLIRPCWKCWGQIQSELEIPGLGDVIANVHPLQKRFGLAR